MSLILNFEICQANGCKDLIFSETTGKYDATYNTGGYGAPNETTAAATTATLTTTNPSGLVTTIDLMPEGFPTDDIIADGYTITSSTVLPDGMYTFVYKVTYDNHGSIVTYSKSISKLFYCNAECCVNQMLSNLNLTCDCCETDENIKDYYKAWTFLQALKNAAQCGDVTTFTNILKIITKLCKNNNCKTCK
jgi:hypothetical protein